MVLWLFLLSCVTAGFSVVGFVIIWLVEKPWFIKMVPSPYGRIGWCAAVASVTVLFVLNFLFITLSYNIFKGTGSPWAVQFAAWGAKWVSPITTAVVIALLFGRNHHPLATRGEAVALLLYAVGALVSLYWRTPFLRGG